ncbi:Dystrobrevin beta [Lucilia cuprina]|nr:Dystrobrevin beta [Lucilia cuprina]KAI8122838.1 Dystrobrevin beta [Lucilia cuprina]
MDKITGIRFKCQSCKDLSLCLKCFATGYSTNKHVVGHKMYEVFTEDLPTKKFSHYFAKLCTVFFCNSEKSNEEESKGFCNINDTVVHNDTELVTIATNRTSNASTVSVKAAAATAVANLNHSQSPNKKIQSSNIQKIDSSLSCLTTTASTALNVSGKLQIIIDKLLHQNEKLELQLKCVQTSTQDELSRFLSDHQQFLMDIITEMRNFSQHTSTTEAISSFPTSSTPNRSNFAKTSTDLDNFSAFRLLNTPKDNLTHSINGADINRSYLDANKSDYSINDLSLWFNQKRSSSSMPPSLTSPPQTLGVLTEVSSQDELNYHDKVDDVVLTMHTRETEMTNFKLLLHKVKEIVEDSYSDNTELSEATQNLENVLDSIIKTEEGRRKSLN